MESRGRRFWIVSIEPDGTRSDVQDHSTEEQARLNIQRLERRDAAVRSVNLKLPHGRERVMTGHPKRPRTEPAR